MIGPEFSTGLGKLERYRDLVDDWRAFAQKSMSSKSIERWKTLSPATLGALAPIVNPMLERHGYRLLKEAKARSREDARRRYNMGLMMQALKGDEA